MSDTTNDPTVDLGIRAEQQHPTGSTRPAGGGAGYGTDYKGTKSAPRRVRIGTIVWGGILLLIAGLTLASVFVDSARYAPSLWIWGVIGIGTLLVLAGVIGAIVRGATGRAARRRAEEMS